YDAAFTYYRRANETRHSMHVRNQTHFDHDAHRMLVDRIMAVFNEEYFARTACWRTETTLPIYMVGMPRCGSTLLEQIIATSPRVEPLEELGRIPRLAQELAKEAGTAELFATPWPIRDAHRAQALAAEYLRLIQPADPQLDRVTMKTLENFLYLGL